MKLIMSFFIPFVFIIIKIRKYRIMLLYRLDFIHAIYQITTIPEKLMLMGLSEQCTWSNQSLLCWFVVEKAQ